MLEKRLPIIFIRNGYIKSVLNLSNYYVVDFDTEKTGGCPVCGTAHDPSAVGGYPASCFICGWHSGMSDYEIEKIINDNVD